MHFWSHALQQVCASTAKVRGNHLVFLTATRELAAVFHLDLVESWAEIEPEPYPAALLTKHPPAWRSG